MPTVTLALDEQGRRDEKWEDWPIRRLSEVRSPVATEAPGNERSGQARVRTAGQERPAQETKRKER
jgi:hypothetical protein